MWPLEVSSEAELEIFEAPLRYERERAGLGFRLEAQVNAVFARRYGQGDNMFWTTAWTLELPGPAAAPDWQEARPTATMN